MEQLCLYSGNTGNPTLSIFLVYCKLRGQGNQYLPFYDTFFLILISYFVGPNNPLQNFRIRPCVMSGGFYLLNVICIS